MKIFFVFALVFAVTSFSPYAFSSPGKRTYLGSDTEEQGKAYQEVLQEVSQEIPAQLHTEECNLTENIPQEQIQEQISKEELLADDDMVKAINELVLTGQILSEKDISIEELKNNLSKTVVSETAASQPPIISHEGVPLKWEYNQ